jgi:hypothetical protein
MPGVRLRGVDGIRLEMPRIGTRKVYYLCRDKFRAMHMGRDKLNRILKANHLLQKPLFISCDNKLPPSVPCTQKFCREP